MALALPRPRLFIPVFCLTAMIGLAAHAQGKSGRAVSPSSLEQWELFCEEEQRHSEPWIRWASENRSLCISKASSPAERANCLESIRWQLDALVQEHQATYLGQMAALKPEHPVMQGILARLSEHRRFAFKALEEGTEPLQLAAARKESCLRQR